MQSSVEAPTPVALADLVSRCAQIERFSVQLIAAEESRIAALAAGIVTMRGVLNLPEIAAQKLPARQRRIRHWALTDERLDALMTPAIRRVRGLLAVDEHEQVKVLSHRAWRGAWRTVTLWRNGVHDLSSSDLMEYLARLAANAQERAPSVARALLARSEAVAATVSLMQVGRKQPDD